MSTPMKSVIFALLLRTAVFALFVGACLSPSRTFAQVSVTISPTAVNLPAGAIQPFAATVTGSSNSAITWTVQEGATGGTIDGSGLYTAPVSAGAYHVVATSLADGAKSATANVVVPGFVTFGLNFDHTDGTAVLLPSGKVLFAGGCTTHTTNQAEIYDPAVDMSTSITGMVMPRCTQTTTVLPNGKILIAGGQTSGGVTATAELFDPSTETFMATGSMTVPRENHAAALLPNGNVLIVGGTACTTPSAACNSSEIYNPSTGNFSPTGSMAFARELPTATLLGNGTVLVAGGFDCATIPCTADPVAEIYNPSTGIFSQTGTMLGAADEVTSILLSNGKVLFAGGIDPVTGAISGVAELYDTSTGAFTQTGGMNIPRVGDTATLLPGGEALFVGGTESNRAELYDSNSGTFTLTGTMQEYRFNASSVLLPNGKVLNANGAEGSATSTEFYDPTTGTFSSNSVFMKVTRANHTATTLADGTVLVAGGIAQLGTGNVQATAEIYNPSSTKFTFTGSMNAAREYHTTTLLPTGQVLIIGGFTSQLETAIVSTAELYNPAAGTFTLTGSPLTARAQHTATLLQNGKVLILGGQSLNPSNPSLASAELYDPSTGGFSDAGNMNAPRYGHSATLLNDGRVLIAGGISSPTFFHPPNPPAELYDPTTGLFTPLTSATNSFSFPNGPFDSALLPNGEVLASIAFIFDPANDVFNPVPGNPGGLDYKLVTLPNGQVLDAGQGSLFDPSSEVFSFIDQPIARISPTANLLSTGQVLIAGGAANYQVDLYQAAVAVPAPVVTSVSPNPVTGFSAVTITVQGSNFAPGAVVSDLGQGQLQTTYVSSAQLTAVFPAANMLASGNHSMEVENTQDAGVAQFILTVVNPEMGSSVTNGGSLPFGNVNLGASSTQSVTFTNVGNATLTLNSFGISGANVTDFSILASGTTCPLQGGTLSALGSCVVNIQFTPSAVGLFGAELTAVYQNPTSPMIIPLSGTGIGVPVAAVTPPALTFGSQGLGTSSASQTVTIQNNGTAVLAITNIAATSGYIQTNNCPSSLAISGSCSVFVTFVPTLVGANGGTLSVTASDSANPHVVQLAGAGIGASTSAISPPSLIFGNQTEGTSSAAQQVTVASVGTANLLITSIALTDTADFTETNSCPSSLAPNSNCSIAVIFVPASGGNIAGSLVITANDGSPHTIPLSGTGENFSISPTTGSSSSATVPAGQPATYQMSLSPQIFSGTVNLTCAEVTPIPGAACLISPSQANLTGSAAVPVTVTVTTTARSLVMTPIRVPRFQRFTIGEMRTLQWLLDLILLVAFLGVYRLARRRIPFGISACILLILIAVGCGSTSYSGGGNGGNVGSTGTPAGTYQLLISATSAGVSKTITLKLIVQ